MKRDELLDQIKEKIERNNERLQNCPHHVFVKNENLSTYIPRYTCQKCGGIVSQAEKTYYEIGVRHGSRGNL
jgi:ArsR family metal-binding transcriptional regulator